MGDWVQSLIASSALLADAGSTAYERPCGWAPSEAYRACCSRWRGRERTDTSLVDAWVTKMVDVNQSRLAPPETVMSTASAPARAVSCSRDSSRSQHHRTSSITDQMKQTSGCASVGRATRRCTNSRSSDSAAVMPEPAPTKMIAVAVGVKPQLKVVPKGPRTRKAVVSRGWSRKRPATCCVQVCMASDKGCRTPMGKWRMSSADAEHSDMGCHVASTAGHCRHNHWPAPIGVWFACWMAR
mmetsp:Transcript_3584/g.11661  ORF Transcript_3584/g.11661 Transcript_3584/m.11661 type:complete len:241 (+) Transcript_3584:169-891(+)